MIAQLLPKNGGAPITLTEPITVVGRSAKLCDLVLDHTSISKQHCMLVKTDGLVYLRDLGSTNGTRVNGQRVIRGALLPGDMLSFAGVTYKVHMGPDAPPATKRRESHRLDAVSPRKYSPQYTPPQTVRLQPKRRPLPPRLRPAPAGLKHPFSATCTNCTPGP